MLQITPDRELIIRSKMAEGYQLSEIGLNSLQHLFTDWFPRSLYFDLTDDTASVDVVVKKNFTSGKSDFSATFKRADGSTIKSMDYSEERLLGKACIFYDPRKTHYDGNQNGYDQRRVFYMPDASKVTSAKK